MVWILRAAALVVLRDRAPAGGVDLDRIDAALLGELQGLEDLGLGVVGPVKSFEAYIRSRLWAQPPIRLPPRISRLSDTLPILPQRQAAGRNVGLGSSRR